MMDSQGKIMELCRDDLDMAELGANAEMVVRHYRLDLDPSTEEFYAEVLREMGQ